MALRIAFLNVAESGRPLYLNPILVQSLAGAVTRELAGVRVDVVDSAAGDVYYHALEDLSAEDVAVACLMADCQLDRFLAVAASHLKVGATLILIGDLVTDGNARYVISRAASALPENPTYAFIGRETDRFIQMIRAVGFESSMADVPNAVSLPYQNNGLRWEPLPSTTKASRLLFTETIVRAIEERGIAVLAEGLTRGCEHHCTYCHLNFNKQTRGLVQRVGGDAAQRIADVARCTPSNSFIFFTDENFFGGRSADSKDRLETIVRLSRDLVKIRFSRSLAVDTRIDSLSHPGDDFEKSQLRRLAWQSFKAAGLKYAYLGVESFSETQLRRYAKIAQYPAIMPGIDFARELGIAFTLGMIIMDPFVTVQEIKETLALVERLDLYRNIASLLKPLRLGVKSPYSGWASKKLPDARVAAFPSGVETFTDTRVNEIWPVAHHVHKIFVESGYRHSDAALFDSVFGINHPSERRIPELVSHMEWELLATLIDAGPTDTTLGFVQSIVERAVHECQAQLAGAYIAIPGTIQDKVARYYRIVLSNVSSRISPSSWLEGALQ